MAHGAVIESLLCELSSNPASAGFARLVRSGLDDLPAPLTPAQHEFICRQLTAVWSYVHATGELPICLMFLHKP